MARTDYHYEATGLTLYAKPQPLTTADWGVDVIAGTENGTTGSYAFVLTDDDADYWIYQQAGGSPASSDVMLGAFPHQDAAIKAQTDRLQFDADDNVLANAVEGSGAFSVSVLPAIGITADRSPGVSLKAFTGETITQSITLYETDGTTPVVLTGKTLVIVFETRQGVDVATVDSEDITIGGDDDNVVTFAYPAAATAKERVLAFAIRDAASPEAVYLPGLLKVTRAPRVDPVEP